MQLNNIVETNYPIYFIYPQTHTDRTKQVQNIYTCIGLAFSIPAVNYRATHVHTQTRVVLCSSVIELCMLYGYVYVCLTVIIPQGKTTTLIDVM